MLPEFAATDAATLTIYTITVIIVSFLTYVFVMNLRYRAPHPGKKTGGKCSFLLPNFHSKRTKAQTVSSDMNYNCQC